MIQLARANARALSPLEITLKIWAAYAADTQAIGVAGWIRAYLARHKTGGDPLEQLVPLAAQVLESLPGTRCA